MTVIIDSTATDVTNQTEATPAKKATKVNNLKNVKKAISNPSNDPATYAGRTLGGKKKAKVAPPTSTDPVTSKVIEAARDVVSVGDNLPALSGLQIAVRDARTLHRRMKSDFIHGIADIAQQVMIAKVAAKKEGVVFESLFGDPENPEKFPFSQNWANTIVRVYESKLLTHGDVSKLPSDLTTLATLASIKPEQRDAVLKRYEEIRTGDYNVIEGEVVLAKINTQKAMKKAKADVTGEDEEEPKAAKKPKDFNATRMARVLLRELGTDGLSELADAIELLLAEEGVR